MPHFISLSRNDERYERFEPEPDYRIRRHRHSLTKIARHNETFNLAQFPVLYQKYFTKSIKSVYKGKLLDLVSHFDDIFRIEHNLHNNATFIISLIYKHKHHKHKERGSDKHHHHKHQSKHKNGTKTTCTPATNTNVDPEDALRNFEKHLSQNVQKTITNTKSVIPPTLQQYQLISYQPVIIQQPASTTNICNVINTSSSPISFSGHPSGKVRKLDRINDGNNGYVNTEPPLKKQKLNDDELEINDCALTDIKIENIGVESWNFYAIICWLNRVNNGAFKGVKYMRLRRGIFTAKMKGFELSQITNMVLRMNGIQNVDEQQYVLNSIDDLIANDSFDNSMVDTLKMDMVPMEYCDAVSFEIMHNPIKIAQSGLFYERDFIEGFIKEYHEDPITKQHIFLDDIILCDELKDKINVWRRDNFFGGNLFRYNLAAY